MEIACIYTSAEKKQLWEECIDVTSNLASLIAITNFKGEWGKPLSSQNDDQGGQYAAHSNVEFITAELNTTWKQADKN